MMRWDRPAAAWFALSLFALTMALSTLDGAMHPANVAPHASFPLGMHPPPASDRAVPKTENSLANMTPHPLPAEPARDRPPHPVQQGAQAGIRLLKCTTNGKVTYTNNALECPSNAPPATVTLYPTKGFQPAR